MASALNGPQEAGTFQDVSTKPAEIAPLLPPLLQIDLDPEHLASTEARQLTEFFNEKW